MAFDVVYTAIFAILAAGGVFSSVISFLTIFAIVKHRKDNAPLLSFFLNKDSATKELLIFRYPGTFLFFTGLFTLVQKLTSFYPSLTAISGATFLLAYLSGLVSLFMITVITWRWFVRFKRFL